MVKVSLIYAKSGGGHVSLAKATEEALNRFYPRQFQVAYCDPFPPIYSRAYRRLGSDWQRIWDMGFRATDNASFTRILLELNSLPTADNLSKHFSEFRPDIILSNNPMANLSLDKAMEKSGINPKIILHFCDPFTLHKAWLTNQNADLYFSPTIEDTQIAIQAGVPQDKIKTVGWLTRQAFHPYPPPIKKARENLGLPQDKFIVFVGGAGQGGGKLLELCSILSQNSTIMNNCFLIVNTGLNSQLVSKISRLAEKHPSSFYLIPYAHNLPQLLWASDITVGKAGPNFLFESVHCLKPILATGAIPGQENGNLQFIIRENLGWVEEDLEKNASLIESLSTDPRPISQKIPGLKRIKKNNLDSNRKIATEIFRLSKSHN